MGRGVQALVLLGAALLIASQVHWERASLVLMIPIMIATVTQLLPVLAVLSLARPVPPARKWIAIWALAFFLSDITQLVLQRVVGNNLFFFSISHPIEDGLLLWAYSHWQSRPVTRLAFRLAIPLLAIVSFIIALQAGEVATFQSFSSPFRTLLLMTAVVYTLVSRAAREEGQIKDRDWLWTSLGVALYFGAYVTVEPITKMLLPQSPELGLRVFVAKACFDTVAYLLVWKGMRCPVPQAPVSFGSTSVLASPSP